MMIMNKIRKKIALKLMKKMFSIKIYDYYFELFLYILYDNIVFENIYYLK